MRVSRSQRSRWLARNQYDPRVLTTLTCQPPSSCFCSRKSGTLPSAITGLPADRFLVARGVAALVACESMTLSKWVSCSFRCSSSSVRNRPIFCLRMNRCTAASLRLCSRHPSRLDWQGECTTAFGRRASVRYSAASATQTDVPKRTELGARAQTLPAKQSLPFCRSIDQAPGFLEQSSQRERYRGRE